MPRDNLKNSPNKVGREANSNRLSTSKPIAKSESEDGPEERAKLETIELEREV